MKPIVAGFLIFSLLFIGVANSETSWDICAGCPSSSPDSGEVVGTLSISDEKLETLDLDIQLTEPFEELHIWYGDYDEELPTLPSGGLAFGHFPYKYTTTGNETSHQVSFELDLGCNTTLNLVLHLAMSSGETAIAGGNSGSDTNSDAVQWEGSRWGWTLSYTTKCDVVTQGCGCSLSGQLCAGCPTVDSGYIAGSFDLTLDLDGQLVVTISPSLNEDGNIRCFKEMHFWLKPEELSTYSPGQFPFKYEGDYCQEQVLIFSSEDIGVDDLCSNLYVAIHLAMEDGETAWAVLDVPFDSSRWGWYGQWCQGSSIDTGSTVSTSSIVSTTPTESITSSVLITSTELTTSSVLITSTESNYDSTQPGQTPGLLKKSEHINGKYKKANGKKRVEPLTANMLEQMLEEVVNGDVVVTGFDYDDNTGEFDGEVELFGNDQNELDIIDSRLEEFVDNEEYTSYNIEYMSVVSKEEQEANSSHNSLISMSLIIIAMAFSGM